MAGLQLYCAAAGSMWQCCSNVHVLPGFWAQMLGMITLLITLRGFGKPGDKSYVVLCFESATVLVP